MAVSLFTLRRVEFWRSEGKWFAKMLFLSKIRSDERSFGPFVTFDEMLEKVREIRQLVEADL